MPPPLFLYLQAEKGVAEEAMLGEGGHAHHLSCHSEYTPTHILHKHKHSDLQK